MIFDPIDALQLLFSTHANDQGKADYLAACAVDFINPFKYYDIFASRDIEGYSMGVPFFPWFSSAGKGLSRKDVLDGTDVVRVESCWGGVVAFDAPFFQTMESREAITNKTSEQKRSISGRSDTLSGQPLRFRAGLDLFWEASECCLIHDDLQKMSPVPKQHDGVGIFMNPFVRVAYASRTLWWLSTTRRFERLYSAPY